MCSCIPRRIIRITLFIKRIKSILIGSKKYSYKEIKSIVIKNRIIKNRKTINQVDKFYDLLK